MTRLPFRLSTVMLAGLATLFTYQAYAETSTGAASVKIVTPLILQETTTLNFGNVLIPSSGTTYSVAVTRGGNYTAGSTGTLGNDQTNGQFHITGEPNYVVEINEVSTSSTITGVSFDALRLPATRTINSSGQVNFNVGGDITVDSTAAAGTYDNGELSYTVEALYQ